MVGRRERALRLGVAAILLSACAEELVQPDVRPFERGSFDDEKIEEVPEGQDYWTDGSCGDYARGVPASEQCKELDSFGAAGCCDALGRVLFCARDRLWCIDCDEANPECGWNLHEEQYDCGVDDAYSEDPSGANPYTCPVSVKPTQDYWENGFCGDYARGIPASRDCRGVSVVGTTGCCDGEGRALWCERGKLWCAECGEDPYCGWRGQKKYYACGAGKGDEDPDGYFPYACIDSTIDTDADPTVRKSALVVGISDYPSDPLEFCDEDASDWYQYLSGRGYDVTVLGHDERTDYPSWDGAGTKSAIRAAVRALVLGADANDKVALSFSGHGLFWTNQSVFLTYDLGYYSSDELAADLSVNPAVGGVFLFFDSCNSGDFGTRLLSSAQADTVYATTTCTAAGFGYEVDGNGEWTHTFLDKALKEKFFGSNVSMEKAFDYAEGIYEHDGIDAPQAFDGDEDASFYLLASAPPEETSGFETAFGLGPNTVAEPLDRMLEAPAAVTLVRADWSVPSGRKEIDRIRLRGPVDIGRLERTLALEQTPDVRAPRCLADVELLYEDDGGRPFAVLGLCAGGARGDSRLGFFAAVDEDGRRRGRLGISVPRGAAISDLIEEFRKNAVVAPAAIPPKP